MRTAAGRTGSSAAGLPREPHAPYAIAASRMRGPGPSCARARRRCARPPGRASATDSARHNSAISAASGCVLGRLVGRCVRALDLDADRVVVAALAAFASSTAPRARRGGGTARTARPRRRARTSTCADTRKSATSAKYGCASAGSWLVNSRSIHGPPKSPGGRLMPCRTIRSAVDARRPVVAVRRRHLSRPPGQARRRVEVEARGPVFRERRLRIAHMMPSQWRGANAIALDCGHDLGAGRCTRSPNATCASSGTRARR